MCARFTQSYAWRELVELYRLTQPALNLRPRLNIVPTTAIDVVRSGDAHSELVSMHWGSCLAANGLGKPSPTSVHSSRVGCCKFSARLFPIGNFGQSTDVIANGL
jgi:hypothetical protein